MLNNDFDNNFFEFFSQLLDSDEAFLLNQIMKMTDPQEIVEAYLSKIEEPKDDPDRL